MADSVSPLVETPPAQTPPASDNLSLEDHERQFGSDGPPLPSLPDATGDSSGATDTDRDAQGRFRGHRHRARSQQAGPDDVPRIRELTKKLRDTESALAAIKTATASHPAATEPARAASVSSPPVSPRAPASAPADVKAKPNLEQFTDYNDYVEALAEWKTDQRFVAEATKRREADEQAYVAAENRRVADSWRTRVDAAVKKYPDFEAVALKAPCAIQPGSIVDAWILEHKAGADVLYYLQQHPEDVPRLNGLSPLDQVEELTLLSQRLVSPPRAQAASTGSAAAPHAVSAPRPPNPVRTGRMRTGEEPPGDEASLADHEAYYYSANRH